MAVIEPIGFSVVSLDKKIVEGDDAIMELIQYGPSELIGHDALFFTHNDDLNLNTPALDALIHTGKGFRITKRFVRSNGDVVWVQNTAGLVKHLQGTPFITCATVHIPKPDLGCQLAGRYNEARRLCRFLIAGRAAFGAETFWAPPVEILLYLYREETEATGVVVDQLAHAINVATSTTMRWLRMLEKQKLVEVEGGGCVAPDAFVRIGGAAEQKLDGLLSKLSQGL